MDYSNVNLIVNKPIQYVKIEDKSDLNQNDQSKNNNHTINQNNEQTISSKIKMTKISIIKDKSSKE